jgi:hypothetical protein
VTASPTELVGESAAFSIYRPQEGLISDLGIDPSDLGLDADIPILIEDLDPREPNAPDVDTAASRFQKYGVAVLDTEQFRLIDTQEKLADMVTELNGNTERLLKVLSADPRIVIPKAFKAYNGTPRLMSVIPYQMVKEHFAHVIDWQRRMLPTVRKINGDPETKVSENPNEGSVINIQTMRRPSVWGKLLSRIHPTPPQKQSHGGHKDFVGPTMLIYGENVGPQGDTVVVLGYSKACEEMQLNEHLDFNGNLAQILQDRPEALTFRRHRVERGTAMIIDSTKTHLITTKSSDQVEQAIADGYEPIKAWHDPKTDVVRLVYNLAFENTAVQKVDKVLRGLVLKWIGVVLGDHDNVLDHMTGAALLEAVNDEADLNGTDRKAIISGVYGMSSAGDLYRQQEASRQRMLTGLFRKLGGGALRSIVKESPSDK